MINEKRDWILGFLSVTATFNPTPTTLGKFLPWLPTCQPIKLNACHNPDTARSHLTTLLITIASPAVCGVHSYAGLIRSLVLILNIAASGLSITSSCCVLYLPGVCAPIPSWANQVVFLIILSQKILLWLHCNHYEPRESAGWQSDGNRSI